MSPIAIAALVMDYADAAGVRVGTPQFIGPRSLQQWPKVMIGDYVSVARSTTDSWSWHDSIGNTRDGDLWHTADPAVISALVWLINKRVTRARNEIEYLVEPAGAQSYTAALLAAADRAVYAAQIGARFRAHPHSEGMVVRPSVVVDDVVVEWSRREDKKHQWGAPWLVCDRHGEVLPPSAAHAHGYAFDAIRHAILIVARARMEAAFP